jgi:hypothetical protein
MLHMLRCVFQKRTEHFHVVGAHKEHKLLLVSVVDVRIFKLVGKMGQEFLQGFVQLEFRSAIQNIILNR